MTMHDTFVCEASACAGTYSCICSGGHGTHSAQRDHDVYVHIIAAFRIAILVRYCAYLFALGNHLISNNTTSLVDTKDISALLNLKSTLQIHKHQTIQILLRLPTYIEADTPGPTQHK